MVNKSAWPHSSVRVNRQVNNSLLWDRISVVIDVFRQSRESIKHLSRSIKEGFIGVTCSLFPCFTILYIFSGWIIYKAPGDIIDLFSSSLHLRNCRIKGKVEIQVLCYDVEKFDGPIYSAKDSSEIILGHCT